MGRTNWIDAGMPPRPGSLRVREAMRLLAALGGLAGILASRAYARPQQQPAAARGERPLAASGDAFVRELRAPGAIRWRFGTARVEKQVQLRDGSLALLRFTDRATRREYVQGPSDVLQFRWNEQLITGRGTPWVLDRVTTRRLGQGELLFQLTLHTAEIAVVKSYLLYPEESIIQEWLQITNRSRKPAVLADPMSLDMQVLQREGPAAIDFSYISEGPDFRLSTARLDTVSSDPPARGIPLHVYHNRETQAGLFMGWDYFGQAVVRGGRQDGDFLHLGFGPRHQSELAPGDSIELPKAFTGTFHGDWDAVGQQLLDYQYRYKWKYTRAAYFPATLMLGYWAAGSAFANERMSTKGIFDPVSIYRKVFALADIMRTTGTDVYWRDNGWSEKKGDWNGPNWAETRRYLSRYGMRQVVYMPTQEASPDSRVAVEHPDWLTRGLLNQADPRVIDWTVKLVGARRRQWGDFVWRRDWWSFKDSAVKQNQGFWRITQTVLDRYPGMALNDNAGYGIDMVGLAVDWGFLGGGRRLRWAYYLSYIFPPDKMYHAPDDWELRTYNKAEWRKLLALQFPLSGITEDPNQIEGVRELFDLYHYLASQGVVGRWVRVYHPKVEGDSANGYLERLSRDRRRGIIIPWYTGRGPVTVYPKGLLANVTYTVSYHESGETVDRLGADLMAHGITLTRFPPGELIYLNLPLHPGSPADRTPPSAPTHVTQRVATHMDYSGVALRWRPGGDNNWISYYQIYRNGVPIDKVAKGTYYFDHALEADPAAQYAVATVDGSGNRSTPAPAGGIASRALLVWDDTSHALTYSGSGWEHQTGQWAVARGTQARTNTRGDAVQVAFAGSRITWYGRMGRDKGIAAVYVDGRLDRLVDTYAADETPNIALYSRTFPTVEQHTLTIVATGAQTGVEMGGQSDSTQHWIVVDGVQVDSTAWNVAAPMPGGGVRHEGAWQRPPSGPDDRADAPRTSPVPEGIASDGPGDRATYAFTGRAVTWVGRRCSTCGMADVYLDGQLATTVDTYARPVRADSLQGDEQRDVPLFTQRWARPGKHVLTIVVRPDANLRAQGHTVHLDALHVAP